MVKSGDIHPAALPFDRPESRPLWLRPKAMLTTAGVVACAALLAAGIALTQTLDQKPAKERIALFGIDAPANDNDAVTAAADTSIRSSFATLQRDVAASADTEGTPVRDRTARALQLHATYAITGSATRLGDKISVSIRLEDAPSHTAVCGSRSGWPDCQSSRPCQSGVSPPQRSLDLHHGDTLKLAKRRHAHRHATSQSLRECALPASRKS